MEARKAHIVGYMHFHSQFSEAMIDILEHSPFLNDYSSLEKWNIDIRFDHSLPYQMLIAEYTMYSNFLRFMKVLMVQCGIDEKVSIMPIKTEKPIFGHFSNDGISLRHYIAPGMLLG